MVIKTVLYTLGIYLLIKTLIIMLFKKRIVTWASKIINKKKGVISIAIAEIILALIFIIIAYFL